MNYEIPNFTARMKVCKDLKLVEKNVESHGSTFFCVVGGIYVGKGILWERRENVGDEYKCM